jgi:DNA-binding IclR family transcriptional regulator
MTRNSPAVHRIVSVLDFFVEHPNQPFTLSQIVKSLHLSRATCHALLASLVEVGYLYRTPDKSFVIGPGLIALGDKAQRHFAPHAVARQELRLLADELDLVAAVLEREGDDVVLRERAASLSHIGWTTSGTNRFPLRTQGLALLALLPEGELQRELDRLRPALPDSVQDEVRAQMQFVRRHGFVLGVHAEDASWSELAGTPWASHPRFVTELDPSEDYALRFLFAPVLDARSKVTFAVTLFGFTHPVKGAEVARIGERLCETCRRMTNFLAGKQPSLAS